MVIVFAASVVIIPALISISQSVAQDFSSCYDGICYHKSMNEMNWADAIFYCEHDLEAELVSVQSAAQNMLIYYSLCSGSKCWLGLFQSLKGSWMWMDGSLFYYSNWDLDSNQPVSSERVAAMWSGTSKWHSCNPDDSLYALCMKNETPTNPISSAYSIAQDFSACYGGICYHKSSVMTLWSDAVFYCKHLRDAAMVSVHSWAQSQYISNNLCTSWCSLGLFKSDNGIWIWMDGSAFDYSYWSTSEPSWSDSFSGMNGIFGRWYGTDKSQLLYPLCMRNETTNITKSPTTVDPTLQPTPGPIPSSKQHFIALTFTEDEFIILFVLFIFVCLLCACLVYIARRGNRVVSVLPELQMHPIKGETNFEVEKSHAEDGVIAMPGISGQNPSAL